MLTLISQAFSRLKSMMRKLNQLSTIALALMPILGVSVPVYADNQAIYSPPGLSPSTGAPPPPGDGPSSASVIQGDIAPQPVPRGRPSSNLPNGTDFPTQDELRRGKVNLVLNEPQRGTRVALTLQPDELTTQQRSAIEGILGIQPFNGNQPYQIINVNAQQIADMQDILAPFPNAGVSAIPMRDGAPRSWIMTDSPAVGYPKYGSSGIHPVLNAVQPFCRYLVIMGVVCGCIFLGWAGVGIIFGHRNAGMRAAGAAAGLMLLLMAYSIWKIVRFNSMNARGPDVIDFANLPGPQPSRGYTGDQIQRKGQPNYISPTQTNLPQSTGVASVGRSGLPLASLGSRH